MLPHLPGCIQLATTVGPNPSHGKGGKHSKVTTSNRIFNAGALILRASTSIDGFTAGLDRFV
jgi:hypothetical protein